MGEWSVNNQAQAEAVWSRLLGCFGDSVLRKFGKVPPEEWVGAIATLNDHQLARGFRRIVGGGLAHAPSLPEFVRLCRSLTDDADPPPNLPRLDVPDNFNGDDWDIESNLRLLKYITSKPNIREAWGAPGNPRMNIPASAEMTRAVGILVKYKKQWAAMMRNWDVNRETGEIELPPPDDRRIAWERSMEAAEREIIEAA